MMGWWDGKKRSENSDVTEERLFLSVQNGMMVWDVAILVEFIMT